MRIFWTLVAVLVIGSAAAFWMSRRAPSAALMVQADQPAPTVILDPAPPVRVVASAPVEPDEAARAVDTPAAPAPVQTPVAPPIEAPLQVPAEAVQEVETVEAPTKLDEPATSEPPAPSITAVAASDEAALDPVPTLDELLGLLEHDEDEQDEDEETNETAPADPAVAETEDRTRATTEVVIVAPPADVAPEPKGATPKDHEHVERTGAAALAAALADPPAVDKPVELRGSGTKEDPYRIGWELLVSASQTYRPKDGLTAIPPVIEQLEGAYVQIGGYFMVPWGSKHIEDVLLMRNMWDGCCIGVPPTPYDALEAQLEAPMDRSILGTAQSATLVGRFKIDPYLERDWLLALYVIEGGVLKAEW